MGMMRVGMGATCVNYDANWNCIDPAPASGGGSGFWDQMANLAASWSKTGQDILKAQNVTRGVLTQTGPGGTSTYVQPEGSKVTLPVGWASQSANVGANASSGFGLMLAAGVGIVVLMMMMRRPN